MNRALVALALAAGCALSAEGEIRDLSITRHDIAVPGTSIELPDFEPTITTSFTQRQPDLGLPDDGFTEVTVRAVTITARAGVEDLSFVRSLRITVAPAEGGVPVEIARYNRDLDGPAGPVLIMREDPAPDVIEAWQSERSVIAVEATGTLPERDWSVDVTVTYGLRVTY